MSKKTWGLVVIVVLLAGVAGAWWAHTMAPHRHQWVATPNEAGGVVYTCSMHPQVRQDQPGNCPICGMQLVKRDAAPTAKAEPLYWYDPMRPDQHFDQPGKSPFMDMQLVPKYADDAGADTPGGAVVTIDPRMAQNLGMRTAVVKAGTFLQRVEATGSVAVDERRIAVVSARAEGWVERLHVNAVGDTVRKGQVLAGLYAPEVLAAQEELAFARTLGDATLVSAAQARLRLLNAGTQAQRQDAIVSPQSGVVVDLAVRQGAQVTPGQPLMTLADLSSVWVQVEVPETQSNWLRAGQVAEVRFKGLPGKVYKGEVDYVYPLLDTATRTVRARVVLGNADGALKPGMYGAVTIRGDALHDATRVPTEAVIRTGTRNVVIVAESAGRYRPVAVVPGPERDGEMVVTGGLKPGQHVVVSGQFLIDSEASLQGAYHRMGAASAADATPGQRLDPKPDPEPDHAAGHGHGHGDDRDAGRAP